MLPVQLIPALNDNYIFAIEVSPGRVVVVDPGEELPVRVHLRHQRQTLVAIAVTHHHRDHTAGIAALVAYFGCPVWGPAAEAGRIPELTVVVGEGDVLHLGGAVFEVWHTPGHTAGSLCYRLPQHQQIFVGDTLFAMGCGRLFEGSPAQMLASLDRLTALPPETRVYCAHEYTLANGHFAAQVEPSNLAIRERLRKVSALRKEGRATVPTRISWERATNPFLRLGSGGDRVAAFAALRRRKDLG